MSDLISRADAIHAIEDMPNAYNGWSDTYDKACIIGVLEEIPSADRPTEWIPVSERLPGKDGCYLVSTTGTNNDIIDIAYYTEEIWHKASRIKAWMPLPEPYKGGDSDG